MRYVLITCALSFSLGCDSTGLSTDDASMTDDMGLSDGAAGDLGGKPVMCDPIKQNCPDPNQKCTVATTMGGSSAICVTPTAGKVQEGGACMRATTGGGGGGGNRDMGGTDMGASMVGVDNCDKGLVCVRVGGFGGGGGGGGTNVCRKICKAASDCTATQACTITFNGSLYGTCQTFCALFGTDCTASQTCAAFASDITSTQNNPVAVPICRTTGNNPAYDNCMRASDCAANTTCQQGTCLPLCDDNHLTCPQLPGDGGVPTCQPASNLPNNGGVCG